MFTLKVHSKGALSLLLQTVQNGGGIITEGEWKIVMIGEM